MKTSKKIGLFLSLTLILFTGLLFFNQFKASAATTVTKAQLDAANYIIVQDSGSSFHVNLATNGDTYSFYDSNLFSGPLNFKFKGSAPFCGPTLYGSSDASKGITITDKNANKGTASLNYIDSSNKCVSYTNANISFVAATGSGTVQQGQGCISGADCQNGVCTKTGGDCIVGQSVSQCEQNGSGWALTWLACPVLDAASGISDKLLGIFEDQLSFSVDQLGNQSNITSGAFKVHQSWALIRDIASGLLVIVLLIMVFSQAVSFGPFDAYTVRKLLPRLIAAVILIQISWVGVSWIVDLVNAIARGIANIMFWPFGGSTNLDLWHLLQNANLSNGTLTTLNWAALALGVVLGVAFLFTMLGVAFVALVALLFAVITLIFRKILIITLLIFAPLALLAWILPGTERYFKMWKDNLIKVLAMFPIAVAIIAAGRIFAYVVGTQDNSQILNLFFILVGFFGPLFILPKTFKWGGQAMQMAGNGIMKASSKVSERPKKLMDKRQEGWSAERQRQSQERYARGEGFNITRPWRRPLDLIRSGQVDPTLLGRRRRQAMDAYVARGVESEESDIKAANSRVARQIDILLPDDQDTFARELAAGRKVKLSEDGTQIMREQYTDAQGNVQSRLVYEGSYNYDSDGNVHVSGRGNATLLERRAGLDQITRLGGEGNIERIQTIFEQTMGSGDREQIEMINGFKTAQAGTLFKKLPHIYKNPHYFEPVDPNNSEAHSVHRTVEGMGAEDITALSGTGFGTMARVLQDRMVDDSLSAAEKGEARNDLARLITVTSQAITNPSTSSRVPPDIARRLRNLLEQPDTGQPNALRPIVGEEVAQGIINTVNQREGVSVAPAAAQPAQQPQTYSPNPTGAYTYRPSSGVNTPTEGELDIRRDDNPTNNP